LIVSNRGFTLIEVLIALVISAMATVSLGYFVAGAGRMQNESNDISSAGMLADTVLELIVLHHQTENEEINTLISSAKTDGWNIQIQTRKPEIQTNLVRIDVIVSSSNLKKSIVVSRLLQLQVKKNQHEI